MIGASKILTVSYGTFSCTLEGFDEPFNTMKAIAEYFRDLAADDRYFGAEPPTPDAAMLHRIAEREIQRRVEAKISEHGVTLRAEEAAAPALQSPAPVVVTMPAVEPEAPPAPTLAPVLEQTETDNVAARLAMLRGTPPAAQPGPAAQPALTELYAEDQDSDSILSNLAVLTARADASPAASYVLDEDVAPAQSAAAEIAPQPAAHAVADAPVADLIEDLPESRPQPVPESHGAEAEADRLVVLEDALPEDQAEDQADDNADAAVAEAMVLRDNVEDAETLPETQAAAASDYDEDAGASQTDDDDATLAMLARFATSEPVEAAPVADPAAVEPEALPQVKDQAADTAALSDLFAKADEPAAPSPAEALPTGTVAQPAAEKLQRARARVIKIRRTEPQPAAAQPVADAAPVPAAPVPAAPVKTASLLSDEAEAALQAELAALEAELGGDATAPVAPHRPVRPLRPAGEPDARMDRATRRAMAREEASAKAQLEGRALLETDSAAEDVERLIAATNSAMDGEDNKRRHSAIAHLKAAVAATEADRQVLAANPGMAPPSRQDVYRSDLQSVVRPANPDQRAASDRPPMLVLVSEQRIDRAQAKPHSSTALPAESRVIMPTRPRRVTSAAPLTAVQSDTAILRDDDEDDDDLGPPENVFNPAHSFSDFAESLGASTLHDVLEASAVYCAQILGCPQFSRTLVMQQLESLPGDAPSREDSLRVFGTLLREGRITKIRRNQFAVTDRSPLLAEALRNAG